MKQPPHYILDIETRSLPPEKLAEIMPVFEAAKNLKDELKIEADIAAKKQSWLDSAALEAHRAELLAIGILMDGEYTIMHGMGERLMLAGLRDFAVKYAERTVVGHNLLGFDIPILVKRMLCHGITPPKPWTDCTPWKASWAFDTMTYWSMGGRDSRDRISLDMLAWALGVGRKTGSGADFAALYAESKEKAVEYLKNDLKLTEGCYQKLRFPGDKGVYQASASVEDLIP